MSEWYIDSLWGLGGCECGFGVLAGGELGLSGTAMIACRVMEIRVGPGVVV